MLIKMESSSSSSIGNVQFDPRSTTTGITGSLESQIICPDGPELFQLVTKLTSSDSDPSDPNIEVSQLQTEDDSTQSSPDPVILCVIYDHGKMGAAFYNLQTAKILVVPDTVDRYPEFRITRSLFRQLKPLRVITLNKTSESFVKAVVSVIKSNGPQEGTDVPTNLHSLSKKAYPIETCKQRVLTTILTTEPANSSEDDRAHYLQTVLDFACEVMIHALGVLLMFIDKNWTDLRSDNSMQNRTGRPLFYSIDIMSANSMVLIDDETFKALQIFDPFDQKTDFKKGSSSFDKPKISLYSIFNKSRTVLGRTKMREYFLHPTNDLKIIQNRHTIINFFKDIKNEHIVKSILDSLRYVTNLNPVFAKILGFTARSVHWKIFYKTVRSCVEIGYLLRPYDHLSPLFAAVAEPNEAFQLVTTCIDEVVDFTSRTTDVNIKMGIDAELDQKKENFEKLAEAIGNVSDTDVPEYITDKKICFLSEVGYILQIGHWKPNITMADIDALGFPVLFRTPTHIYLKSPTCTELDGNFGGIKTEILSHESKILLRLVHFIEKKFPYIQNFLTHLGELDCLITMALIARQFELVQPHITNDEKTIEIQNGRHPLIELYTENFVLNDFSSSSTDALVKIITGPNGSGKSVFMKQVAIIAYMVHIGSFVPAESVKISLLDTIHTRIKTLESICTEVSTFLIDLRQMGYAIWSSGPRSLIVIDEFGIGTTELDGASLLAACLEEFLQRGDNCPHILMSTHYSQLSQILSPSVALKYLKMDYTLTSQGRIVYLYRIVEGQTEGSQAIQICKSEKFEPHVIDRMEQMILAMKGLAPFPSKLRLRNQEKRFQINLRNVEDELVMVDLMPGRGENNLEDY